MNICLILKAILFSRLLNFMHTFVAVYSFGTGRYMNDVLYIKINFRKFILFLKKNHKKIFHQN